MQFPGIFQIFFLENSVRSSEIPLKKKYSKNHESSSISNCSLPRQLSQSNLPSASNTYYHDRNIFPLQSLSIDFSDGEMTSESCETCTFLTWHGHFLREKPLGLHISGYHFLSTTIFLEMKENIEKKFFIQFFNYEILNQNFRTLTFLRSFVLNFFWKFLFRKF